MLIGKSGSFTIKSPFNKLGSKINGKIVELSYIKHEVSTGTDVENRVYGKVGALDIYPSDLNRDVLLVTIKSGGTKYRIPDIYIEGLYDNNLNYLDSYLTVKVGPLPANYDFTATKEAIARGVSDTVGVNVSYRDITVSVAGKNSIIKTVAEASYEENKRLASVANNISDYGKLINAEEEITKLNNEINSILNFTSGLT